MALIVGVWAVSTDSLRSGAVTLTVCNNRDQVIQWREDNQMKHPKRFTGTSSLGLIHMYDKEFIIYNFIICFPFSLSTLLEKSIHS
jgi:hypothetical protein